MGGFFLFMAMMGGGGDVEETPLVFLSATASTSTSGLTATASSVGLTATTRD